MESLPDGPHCRRWWVVGVVIIMHSIIIDDTGEVGMPAIIIFLSGNTMHCEHCHRLSTWQSMKWSLLDDPCHCRWLMGWSGHGHAWHHWWCWGRLGCWTVVVVLAGNTVDSECCHHLNTWWCHTKYVCYCGHRDHGSWVPKTEELFQEHFYWLKAPGVEEEEDCGCHPTRRLLQIYEGLRCQWHDCPAILLWDVQHPHQVTWYHPSVCTVMHQMCLILWSYGTASWWRLGLDARHTIVILHTRATCAATGPWRRKVIAHIHHGEKKK